MSSYYTYDTDGKDPPAGYTGLLLEVCVTQYNHPDITSGMHHNGPPSIFVRPRHQAARFTGEWYLVNRSFHLHQIREIWASFGWEVFLMDEVATQSPYL